MPPLLGLTARLIALVRRLPDRVALVLVACRGRLLLRFPDALFRSALLPLGLLPRAARQPAGVQVRHNALADRGHQPPQIVRTARRGRGFLALPLEQAQLLEDGVSEPVAVLAHAAVLDVRFTKETPPHARGHLHAEYAPVEIEVMHEGFLVRLAPP